MWKLETIGSIISTKMRKIVVEKYLSLHLSYFDIEENSPGALLTKLSIDTTQLNSIVLTLVGDILQTSGNIITGLIIGFRYDYKLTLISLIFIPFIIFALVMVKNLVLPPTKKKDNKTDIEAGAILSECVINTKTIFSFNFQKESAKLYMEVLNSETKTFVRNR